MTPTFKELADGLREAMDGMTPLPWRRLIRRDGYYPPKAGVDSSAGLGWDWDTFSDGVTGKVPPEPMRGLFELGGDAAFINFISANSNAIIEALERAAEIEAENVKLRDLVDAASLTMASLVEDREALKGGE